MGLLVTAVLVSLRLALEGRWTGAGVAGAAAALGHSVGWLLGPVLLAWGIALPGPDGRRPSGASILRGPVVAAALTMAGLGAVLVLHGLTLGVWDAYFRVQGAYGHDLTSPLVSFWSAARGILTPPAAGGPEGPSVQAVVVAGLAIAALATAALRRDREAVLVGLYVAVTWLFPLALGGTVSVYRTDAALLPGVLLARGAPRPVLVGLLAVLVPLAWVMARLFFELRLI